MKLLKFGLDSRHLNHKLSETDNLCLKPQPPTVKN
jgi:hypothetical protein